jgi:hypothetical protein
MKYKLKELLEDEEVDSFLIRCTTLEEMLVVSKFLRANGYTDNGDLEITNFINNIRANGWRDVVVKPERRTYFGSKSIKALEILFNDVLEFNKITYVETL